MPHHVLLLGPPASGQTTLLGFLGHLVQGRDQLHFYEVPVAENSKSILFCLSYSLSDKRLSCLLKGLPEGSTVKNCDKIPPAPEHKIHWVFLMRSAPKMCSENSSWLRKTYAMELDEVDNLIADLNTVRKSGAEALVVLTHCGALSSHTMDFIENSLVQVGCSQSRILRLSYTSNSKTFEPGQTSPYTQESTAMIKNYIENVVPALSIIN